MAKVELTGMDELMKQLSAIGEKIATRGESKALNAGADILQEAISQRAPRLTGKLSENIVKSGIRKNQVGVRYIEVGPSKEVFYGRYLELGTTKMRARPFMDPALEENRTRIHEAMAEILREEIERHR